MVWEVVTSATTLTSDPQRRELSNAETQWEHTGAMMMETDRDQSQEARPPSGKHMDYDDLPELQEVQEEAEQTTPPVYQVEVGVSHQERQQGRTQKPAPPDWLTQLAHIATGPQSPLLQGSRPRSSSPVHIFGTSSNLHSYARPPSAISSSVPSPPRGRGRERRRSRTSSECGSAVFTRSSLSDDEDMGWNFSWPPTAWHCFLKGTRLRFHRGSNVEWQDAEDLDSGEEDSGDEEEARSLKRYGSEGLRLVEQTEAVSSGQSVLQLTFDPSVFGHAPLTAQCQLDH
ncbi:HMG box-containing protein 1-like, partial [Diretmus argenteus]